MAEDEELYKNDNPLDEYTKMALRSVTSKLRLLLLRCKVSSVSGLPVDRRGKSVVCALLFRFQACANGAIRV